MTEERTIKMENEAATTEEITEVSEAELDNVNGGFGIVAAGATIAACYAAGWLYGAAAKRKVGYCR